MGARKHADKNGNSLRTGDACYYRGPEVWNTQDGVVLGVLKWNSRLKCFELLLGGGEKCRPKFWRDGAIVKAYELEKVVGDEEFEGELTAEERKELELTWPEFEYIEEPDLIADELEEGL